MAYCPGDRRHNIESEVLKITLLNMWRNRTIHWLIFRTEGTVYSLFGPTTECFVTQCCSAVVVAIEFATFRFWNPFLHSCLCFLFSSRVFLRYRMTYRVNFSRSFRSTMSVIIAGLYWPDRDPNYFINRVSRENYLKVKIKAFLVQWTAKFALITTWWQV